MKIEYITLTVHTVKYNSWFNNLITTSNLLTKTKVVEKSNERDARMKLGHPVFPLLDQESGVPM